MNELALNFSIALLCIMAVYGMLKVISSSQTDKFTYVMSIVIMLIAIMAFGAVSANIVYEIIALSKV